MRSFSHSRSPSRVAACGVGTRPLYTLRAWRVPVPMNARIALAVLVLVAAAPGVHALSADEARHLLARTGLGPTRTEVEALLPLTRAQAIERVVSSARTTPVTAAPSLDD